MVIVKRVLKGKRRLGTFQAATDVIVDPMVIPPLDWIYLDAIYLHREVKMIPTRQTCGSAFPHLLTTANHLALLNGDLAQVAVDGLQSVSMVQNDAVAINTKRRRPNHLPIVCRQHRTVLSCRKIESEMHLLIDLFTFVNIGPKIREC